jgi:hypothetical protein
LALLLELDAAGSHGGDDAAVDEQIKRVHACAAPVPGAR